MTSLLAHPGYNRSATSLAESVSHLRAKASFDEENIHPLFRATSPGPPPGASRGTVLWGATAGEAEEVVGQGSGQIKKRMESRIGSPLVRDLEWDDEAVAAPAPKDGLRESLVSRAMSIIRTVEQGYQRATGGGDEGKGRGNEERSPGLVAAVLASVDVPEVQGAAPDAERTMPEDGTAQAMTDEAGESRNTQPESTSKTNDPAESSSCQPSSFETAASAPEHATIPDEDEVQQSRPALLRTTSTEQSCETQP